MTVTEDFPRFVYPSGVAAQFETWHATPHGLLAVLTCVERQSRHEALLVAAFVTQVCTYGSSLEHAEMAEVAEVLSDHADRSDRVTAGALRYLHDKYVAITNQELPPRPRTIYNAMVAATLPPGGRQAHYLATVGVMCQNVASMGRPQRDILDYPLDLNPRNRPSRRRQVVASEMQFCAYALAAWPGIPFRDEWKTTTAVALAALIYETRNWDDMPILADALQDAGCDDEALLTMLRLRGVPWCRGAAVLDRLLDKPTLELQPADQEP